MTKERLEQLNYIQKSLDSIRKDIANLNRRMQQSQGKVYADKVKGSMVDFPYIEQRYNVIGIDSSAYDRLREKLSRKEQKLQDKLLELEEWLEGIEDEKLYLIFRLKYRNGMTNAQIGKEVGYSGARISQLISDYLRMR